MALWKETSNKAAAEEQKRPPGSASESSHSPYVSAPEPARARDETAMGSPPAPAVSDADAVREEELNVEILRRRIQARAAVDPDAATFGWVARVGAALRRARDRRGLTQTILSDETKITQGYLSSVETGKLVRGPTIDVLFRYAAALRCDCEITLRDRQTGEVVTAVRSEPVEEGAVSANRIATAAYPDNTRA